MNNEMIAFLTKIAGYTTTVELLDSTDDEDDRLEILHEANQDSADELDNLILEARNILAKTQGA